MGLRRLFLIAAVWLVSLIQVSCLLSKTGSADSLPLVFYNVENLFDTLDDPNANDNEFLPGSEKEWTTERYRKKLEDISAVIVEAGNGNLPGFIGMCEVENRRVLEDLTRTGSLSEGDYGMVHYDSGDSRGIDVAFLFQKSIFQVTESELFPSRPDSNSPSAGREMLYVNGNTTSGEEIHFFVCHWTSRTAGVKQSEGRRVEAAKVLRDRVDRILAVDSQAKIVIMGDMNDMPDDQSIREVLGAVSPDGSNGGLVNLMYPAFSRGEGSYNYQGRWDMLDHIIVSSALLSGPGCYIKGGQGYVHKSDRNTFSHPRGMEIPDRTYSGNRYLGGVSDHFPVVVFLTCRKGK